ncbi:hypothetical protein BH11BAC7_BH11BAC7_20500 [soil metagenome]
MDKLIINSDFYLSPPTDADIPSTATFNEMAIAKKPKQGSCNI